MKKTESIKKTKNYNLLLIVCLLVITLATVACSYFVRTNVTSQYSHYLRKMKVGFIAEENVYVKTTVDILDEDATQVLRENAASSVLPVFSYDAENEMKVISSFDKQKEGMPFSDQVDLLSYNLLSSILEKGYYSDDEIRNVKDKGYSSITIYNSYSNAVKAGSDVEVDNLIRRSTLDSYIAAYLEEYGARLSSEDLTNVALLVKACVMPNVRYDSLLTESRRINESSGIKPVIVTLSKGQEIIAKDKVVTEDQINTLKLLSSNTNVTVSDLLGTLIFSFIVYSAVLYVFAYLVKRSNIHFTQYLLSLTALMIVNLAVVYLEYYFSRMYFAFDFQAAFLSILLVPVMMTMITDNKKVGFCCAFMVGASLSALPGADLMTFFYATISASVSVFFVKFITRRIESFYQWLLSSLVCVVSTVAFVFISAGSLSFLPYEIIGTVINTTLASIMCVIVLPILESAMNLPTVFRLHELAYSDSPLLKKMANAAPGTYTHCRMVADLAANAATEVGANPHICRVGALYHDIGKTEHPEYFVENQGGGENKHDDINPSLSVSILRNHVSVGAEQGKEAGLPVEIVKIIANHHGNDLISYFYHEALKEQKPDVEAVHTEDYSYNNAEIPDTKECAIVMLADGVEAATRTITEPTPAKFLKMIHSIVLGKIERNQLKNSNLSMGDIDKIEQSFINTLTAQYHSRIKYPDEDEE